MQLLNLIKVIITKATKALCTGLIFTVFVAEPSADPCADALEGSGMEKPIATVEASKENEDTSLERSLTADNPESEAMEVLVEPLAYAETDNNSGTDVQRNGSRVSSVSAAVRETTAVKTGNSSAADGSYASLPANTDSHNNSTTASDTGSSSVNAASTLDGNTDSSSVYTAANTTDDNKTTAVSETSNSSANTAASAADGNKTTAAGAADNSSANTAVNATDSNETVAANSTDNNQTYHRTTTIYDDDDTTPLRVEYYDENDKLSEYSVVTDYDKDTNSYTETVYMYDWDEEKEYVTRTNTYVDGELVSSENP